jgi:hypothetical protein
MKRASLLERANFHLSGVDGEPPNNNVRAFEKFRGREAC